MIHLLIEKSYADNNRASLTLQGINSVVKKKRLRLSVYNDIDEIKEGVKVVVLISASLKWTTETIERLNARGIHPLIFGFQYIDGMYQYSCINLSYTKSMYLLTKYLLSKDKGKTALLGFNRDSLPDQLKLSGVKYATQEFDCQLQVYDNDGDVSSCIEKFSDQAKDVKNIVCINDGIAVTLNSLYPQLLENRRVCSCCRMKVGEYLQSEYPTCIVNYFKAGVRLAELYLFLMRCEEISPVVMTLEMDIFIPDDDLLPDLSHKAVNSICVDFYGDKSIREVENLDKMLLNCDSVDMDILRDLIEDIPYEQIADQRHLAVNTVKYRLRAIEENLEVSSRKEVLNLIKKYNLKF